MVLLFGRAIGSGAGIGALPFGSNNNQATKGGALLLAQKAGSSNDTFACGHLVHFTK